jgi:hypothetical protein
MELIYNWCIWYFKQENMRKEQKGVLIKENTSENHEKSIVSDINTYFYSLSINLFFYM